ncbi:MAG: O-antigen ligase family protein, partial [Rhodospirillales bacterium]|nr:O-antigen ligase family protein [Rhodospirillales bacterium]
IIVGILCWVLTFFLPRTIPVIVALSVLVSILAGPFVAQHMSPGGIAQNRVISIPNSAYHRLLIWQFTAGKIAERPMLGWGFNSSKTIPGKGRKVWKGSAVKGAPVLPLHPHNAWLQWWLELGVVGATLGAVLGGGIALRLRDPHMDRAERATSLALLVAVFVIGGVSYGVWQSWWISAILFATVFVVGCQTSDQRRTELDSSQ